METPIEYFFGETMRWSFGFENPNKAAVIFAGALPLLWWCWIVGWKTPNKVWRSVAVTMAGIAILVVHYGLCMTFSRGGLVAAACALAYLLGYEWSKERPRLFLKWSLSGALLAVMLGIVIWTGLGARSAAAASGDASIGNRIELWTGALQMFFENPQGFGAGNSGDQYMQWYQPTERKQGYRTMVNSYLTLLVERGWIVAVGIGLGFIVFWVWTRPCGECLLASSLRASVLGFMVAGIFSTTMEDWRLWIIPLSCSFALMALAISRRNHLDLKRLGIISLCLMLVCLSLTFLGFRISSMDPIERDFGMINGARTVIGLKPKTQTIGSIGCVVDRMVLGDHSPKLLRELALKANIEILLGERAKFADWALWMGHGVNLISEQQPKRLILLAPAKIEQKAIAELLKTNSQVQLLLPEIDEDGRVSFWQDVCDENPASQIFFTTLSGVGNRADWAWDLVIKSVSNTLITNEHRRR